MSTRESLRVLLVASDEDVRLLVRALLAQGRTAFELEARPAGEAAEALQADGHDICLVDSGIGAGAALDLLRRAAASGSLGPIVLLAASDEQALEDEALEAGAADCLSTARTDAPAFHRAIRRAIERSRALEALRHGEERFRALVEHSSDGVFLLDEHERIIYVSRSTARTLGYLPHELLGVDAPTLIHPDDREESNRRYRDSLGRPGQRVSISLRLQHRDGSWRWIEADAVNRLAEPAVGAVVVNYRDVTRRRALEREVELRQQHLDAFFSMAPIGLAIFDGDRRYLRVNETLASLNGVAAADHLGKHVEEVIPELAPMVSRALEQVQRTAQPLFGLEVEGRRGPRGAGTQALRTSACFFPLPVAEGDDTGVGGIVVDVTEHHRAEAAIRESERKYRELADSLPETVFEIDLDLRLTFVNQSAFDRWGYSREDFDRGLSAVQFIVPEQRELARQNIARVLNGDSVGGEYLGLKKDGTRFPITVHSRRVMRDGRPAGLRGIIIDITERKQSEEALRESMERYRYLFERNPNPMLVYDVETLRVLAVNDAAIAHYGYTTSEFLALTIVDMRPEEDRPALLRSLAAGLTPLARPREARHVRKDGSIIDVQVTSHSITFAGRNARVVAIDDVTDRKRTERELRDSERRYRVLFESNLAGVWRAVVGGPLLDCNEAFARMFGYASREDALAAAPGAFQVGGEEQESFTRHLLKQGSLINFESRARRKDGTSIWILENVTLFPGDGTRPAIAQGTTIDITERKQAEDTLRRSEARFRSLVKNAAYGIYRTTLDGRFLDVNPALVSMLGYASEGELLQAGAVGLYRHERERERLIEDFRRTERLDGVELEWRRKDGSTVLVRLTGRGVYSASGELEGFEVMVEDITERRSLESQLRQSQKMEAIGRLAGGVAHDFNNLLTAILGYSQLLLEQTPADAPQRRELEEIGRAGERASNLTRQLLAFSRKQMLQPKPLDLNGVVGSIDTMLRRLIGEDVELVTVATPGIGLVKADPGQVEQVILNLAINARDAMPRGGKLTIETANATLDAAYARQHAGVEPGSYVMLAVSDNGSGMPPEVRSHLFEPFFTTKERGKGTGLGLATVYGIVRQSGGHVFVYSEVGRGTTFKIYLPRVAGVAEPDSVRPRGRVPGGNETILLVEDEAAVRTLAREVLSRHGYRVLEARDGASAMDVTRTWTAPIHLLLTDVVMPGMSGRELVDALQEERGPVRALYISGYTDHAIIRNGELAPGTAFLQKPFTPSGLLLAVRETLDRQWK